MLKFTYVYFTQSKLAKNTQEKTPAKVQNNFNTNKLIYKIMKTLHQIVIHETQKPQYQTTITLGDMGGIKFCVIVKTNHMGVVNEFEEMCDSYNEALVQFLDNIQQYAHHTALMNL